MRLPQLSPTTKRVLEVLVVLAAIVLAILSLRTPTPPSAADTSAGIDNLTTDDITPDDPDKSVLVVSGGALTEKAVNAAAARIKWGADVAVHDGSGIAKAPAGDKPLAVAVRSDAKDVDNDMIVVQGGEFDGAAGDRELEVAIYHLIDWVVAYKPASSIFVLAGPIPSGDEPTADLVRANKLMRLTAARRGVRYIDAIELGWTTNRDLSKPLGDQLLVAAKPRVFPSRPPEPSATASAASQSESLIPLATPVEPPPSPSEAPTSGTTSAAALAPSPAPASLSPAASPSPSQTRAASALSSPSPAQSAKPSPNPKPSPSRK